MPIKLASELTWNPTPRCPRCDAEITPIGPQTPLVQDHDGRIYCREHGDAVEPGYADELAAYLAWRNGRAEALRALEEDAAILHHTGVPRSAPR
jgi:hypothetical protein